MVAGSVSCKRENHARVINERRVVSVEHQEKRIYPRLDLRFPIELKTLNGKQRQVEELAKTANVSSGGVLIESGRYLKPGAHVDVSITVPYTVWNRFPTVKVEAGAEVVRVRSVPKGTAKHGKVYETALRFDEPLRTIVW